MRTRATKEERSLQCDGRKLIFPAIENRLGAMILGTLGERGILPMKTRRDVVLALGFFASLAVADTTRAQIKNAPYCATHETETTQTLADGTHIVRRGKSNFCRDSLGRTRNEGFLVRQGTEISSQPFVIDISDPVQGVRYHLDVRNHRANQMFLQPNAPAPAPQVDFSAPPPVPAPQLKVDRKTENLGSEMMEGVMVQGKRTTTTFPVGYDGNDAPIVTVAEIWSSKDLGVVVLQRRNDPRMGEIIDRLTNIVRSEPDPALFRLPADYSVQDVTTPAGR